jgi:hypothetical protein
MSIEDLTPSTAYTFRVRATDVFGNMESNTSDVSFTMDANQSPDVTAATTPALYSGEPIDSVNAYDSNSDSDYDIDGDKITYTCTFSRQSDGADGNCSDLTNEGGGTASFDSNTGVFSNWKPLHSEIGDSYLITIKGSDEYGANDTHIVGGGISPLSRGFRTSRLSIASRLIPPQRLRITTHPL